MVTYLGKKRLYNILKEQVPDVCKMIQCDYRRFKGVEVLKYSISSSETIGKLSSQFGGKWMRIEETDLDGVFLRRKLLSPI